MMEYLMKKLLIFLNKKLIQREEELMLIIQCLFYLFFYFKSISNLCRHIEETRLVALERQIDYTLALNYERVQDLFNRSDTMNNGLITINAVRTIIEDFIEYTLRPDEYHHLIKKIPMDQYGRVKYKEYLKQIMDRTSNLQEKKQQQQLKSKYVKHFSTQMNKYDRIS